MSNNVEFVIFGIYLIREAREKFSSSFESGIGYFNNEILHYLLQNSAKSRVEFPINSHLQESDFRDFGGFRFGSN